VEWADSEIEFEFADGPTPGRGIGIADMAERWRDQLQSFEDFRGRAEEYRELDDERVLVRMSNSGRGKRSGVNVQQIAAKAANVFQVRDGKVRRLVLYWDRERALADLGLKE
jgi:ketosteroid isomerase-like protein